MKKRTHKHLMIVMLLFAFLMIPSSVVYGKSYKTVGEKYVKAGNRKVALYGSYNKRLAYRENARDITIDTGVFSAISDGTNVFYTKDGSKVLYKWSSKSKKVAREKTLPGSENSPYINIKCGYGNHIFMVYGEGIFYYSITKKKVHRITYSETGIGDCSGKYFLYGYTSTSPTYLYLYDMSKLKSKLITKKAYCGGRYIKGKIYYAEGTTRVNTGYKVAMKSYNLKTKKRNTVSKSFVARYIGTVTNKYVQYLDKNGRWKKLSYK